MARLRGDLGTAAAAMRPVNSDRATRRNKEYRAREKTDDRPLELNRRRIVLEGRAWAFSLGERCRSRNSRSRTRVGTT